MTPAKIVNQWLADVWPKSVLPDSQVRIVTREDEYQDEKYEIMTIEIPNFERISLRVAKYSAFAKNDILAVLEQDREKIVKGIIGCPENVLVVHDERESCMEEASWHSRDYRYARVPTGPWRLLKGKENEK